MFIGAAGIEPHHAGGVGYRFDTGEGEHDSDKASPVLPESSVQWLQMSESRAEMRKAEKPEHDDDDSGWHRNQKSKPAGVLRSKQIEQPDDEDGRGCKFFRMRNTEVLKGGKRADGC